MLDLNQRPKDYETNQGSEGPLFKPLNPCQFGSIGVKCGQEKSFKINNLDLHFAFAWTRLRAGLATVLHFIGNYPQAHDENLCSVKCLANQGYKTDRP